MTSSQHGTSVSAPHTTPVLKWMDPSGLWWFSNFFISFFFKLPLANLYIVVEKIDLKVCLVEYWALSRCVTRQMLSHPWDMTPKGVAVPICRMTKLQLIDTMAVGTVIPYICILCHVYLFIFICSYTIASCQQDYDNYFTGTAYLHDVCVALRICVEISILIAILPWTLPISALQSTAYCLTSFKAFYSKATNQLQLYESLYSTEHQKIEVLQSELAHPRWKYMNDSPSRLWERSWRILVEPAHGTQQTEKVLYCSCITTILCCKKHRLRHDMTCDHWWNHCSVFWASQYNGYF